MNSRIAFKYILIIICSLCGSLPAYWPVPQRKVIEYGWDVRDHNYIQKNIRNMEKLPFDGVVFNFGDHKNPFDLSDTWNKEQLQADFETLAEINWNSFTDNFIFMHISPTKLDWFNDRQWQQVLANVQTLTEAAIAARCVGLCIDPEGYGKPSPWVYDWNGQKAAHADSKTYTQYARQVRKRGSEFIQRIQQKMPNARLLWFFMLTIYDKMQDSSDFYNDTASEQLKNHRYALLYHFVNGMLDSIGKDIVLIEGNEHAYYYTSKSEFDTARVNIRKRYINLIAPENRQKYYQQLQVGAALYMDQIFGFRMQPGNSIGAYLTPATRLALFKQNLYYGLQTSDQYLWCYSERMNWWRGTHPAGSIDAIKAAKSKLHSGREPGIDISKEIHTAMQKKDSLFESELRPLSCQINKIPQNISPPVIDANMDDKAWQYADDIGDFQPLKVELKQKPQAGTNAKVLWDDQNLYVLFICEEPNPAQINIRGSKKDDNIWAGDSVELFISATDEPKPFYHFIVNPANIQWDAITDKSSNDTSWDTRWQSAASINRQSWTAEIAVPWGSISGPPSVGDSRRANLTRYRRQYREWTTWTPLLDSFGDAENFATWTFIE